MDILYIYNVYVIYFVPKIFWYTQQIILIYWLNGFDILRICFARDMIQPQDWTVCFWSRNLSECQDRLAIRRGNIHQFSTCIVAAIPCCSFFRRNWMSGVFCRHSHLPDSWVWVRSVSRGNARPLLPIQYGAPLVSGKKMSRCVHIHGICHVCNIWMSVISIVYIWYELILLTAGLFGNYSSSSILHWRAGRQLRRCWIAVWSRQYVVCASPALLALYTASHRC